MTDDRSCFNGAAVREPRLWNTATIRALCGVKLQWGRGPRTAVMLQSGHVIDYHRLASMGPRSENRGYVDIGLYGLYDTSGFNGAAVREPRLCREPGATERTRSRFNGAAVREPRL